jgi:hypothetical protein
MTVPVSVIIPTSQPWPEIEGCLDSLWPEALELGAEVIVLDPHGKGLPEDAETRYPGVVHRTEPGASILHMRQLGMVAAQGKIVAFTEDHCVVPPGWLGNHIAAHREHPDAAVVGGPVLNGASRRLIDWAIFLQNHARWFPPVPSGERKDIDRSNASYKQRVLPAEASPEGWDEHCFDRALVARGERIWFDGDNLLSHDQSLGFWGTLAIEYHVGRTVAGLAVRHELTGWQRAWRLVTSPLIAAVNLRAVLSPVLRRRVFPRRAMASVPCLAVISAFLAAGFFAGYAAGPGTSPSGLH